MKIQHVVIEEEVADELFPPEKIDVPYDPSTGPRSKEDRITDREATEAAKDAGFVVVDGKKLQGVGNVGKYVGQEGVIDLGRGMLAFSATKLADLSNRFESALNAASQQLEDEIRDKDGITLTSENLGLLTSIVEIQKGLLKQQTDVASRLVKTAPEQSSQPKRLVPGPTKGEVLTPAAPQTAVQVNVNGGSAEVVPGNTGH